MRHRVSVEWTEPTRRNHDQVPLYATKPAGWRWREALSRPNAGDVRAVWRVAGEVQEEPRRHGRKTRRWKTGHQRIRGGRAVRGSQGAGRRLHDRRGRQSRRGDRGCSWLPGTRAPRLRRRSHRDPRSLSSHQLVEHFFRHEYGRLVAMLSRRVGVQHIDSVEDAAQSALMTALESWTVGGLPDNPSAWLFRVAHNNLVGELRQR